MNHNPSLIPGRGGACYGPDRLQKGPHASRIGWVDVVGRSTACLCDGQWRRTCCAVSASPMQWGHARDGEDSCGLFSAERQWCTGFRTSQVSSRTAVWCLPLNCNGWLSVAHISSRHGTLRSRTFAIARSIGTEDRGRVDPVWKPTVSQQLKVLLPSIHRWVALHYWHYVTENSSKYSYRIVVMCHI